jgi:membrane-bound lytic murein transglycosylase F
MMKFLKLSVTTLVFSSLLVTLNACDRWWLEQAAFGGEKVEAEPLRLLVLQKPMTYRKLQEFESGYEFEILQQFAAEMGYKLQVRSYRSEKSLMTALKRGRGDLAAGRFSNFSTSSQDLDRSPVYDEEKTSLVCRNRTQVRFLKNGQLDRRNTWTLLVNPLHIEARWIQFFKKAAPHLKIDFNAKLKSSQALRQIALGHADCTLMDRLEANYYLRAFPNLRVAKDISPKHSYFFLLNPQREDVAQKLRRWMGTRSSRQWVAEAKVRARGTTPALTAMDIHHFFNDRENLLPKFDGMVRKHSESFGIPWQLTAAVAYQESKWNPEARSFTGVEGFMQLTRETAEHLGVEDRRDPDQSIWGGSKYLRALLDRQPKKIPFQDRLALALATYNVGPAHMWDAQKLAMKKGKSPHSWKDLKTILPLLADPDYLPDLKYGPARGQEPVDFVEKVFAYLDLMSIQI